MNEDTPSPLNNVITIDDERIKSHVDRVVRGTVEETGHYERGMQSKAGEVRLRVLKLRRQTFV
jgi:hypothetical protein